MSKLTKKQIEKLPDSCFCGPDRSSPVLDQNDVNDAWGLRGHAANPDQVGACIIRRAKKLGLKPPTEGASKNSRLEDESVLFFESGEFEPTEGMVSVNGEDYLLRIGPLFKLGDYPDKKFSLNEEEADEAIKNFKSAQFNYEHQKGFLDGHLGRITDIWREGDWIYGAAAVHPWIDQKWAKFGRKVSGEWTRLTKSFVDCAMTLDPRVTGAALQAEFTRRDEKMKKKTKLSQILAQFGLNLGEDQEDVEVEVPEEEETANHSIRVQSRAAADPEVVSLRQELDALKKSKEKQDQQIATMAVNNRKKICFSKIEELKKDDYILPAVNVNDDLLTFFMKLAEIDDQDPNEKITFNKTETGGLLDLAIEIFRRFPQNHLTEEYIPFDVLSTDDNTVAGEAQRIIDEAKKFANRNNKKES